ncbi:MAG: 2-phospho-L-lactate guanylyltransferase [Anaerolineaceae bacterium]
MSLAALVPLKPPTEAKARLAGLLSPEERAQLARVTFLTVADALLGARVTFAVLTPDATAAANLTAGRCTVIEEQPSVRGLSAQIETALDAPSFPAAESVLILHADLPLATLYAVRLLAAAARAHEGSVTMVRSADGGTNAMILPLPRPFALHYGRGSFALHAAAARAAGLGVHEHRSPQLTLDLDTATDVQTLLATSRGRKSPAGRLLLSMGVDARLAGTA